MNIRAAIVPASSLLLCASAQAWHVECRWVERVGNTDVPLVNNTLRITDLSTRRLRLQIGVFDDAQGPAPEGGLFSWANGLIHVIEAHPMSINTRTPGRLSGFAFDQAPTANGVPAVMDEGDPFTRLEQIEADMGFQIPLWAGCVDTDGDGFAETPAPRPEPTVIGRNTFVSVYEISTRPNGLTPTVNYQIRAAGLGEGVMDWRPAAGAYPPDCELGEPGQIRYYATIVHRVIAGCSVFVQGSICPCDWNESGGVNSEDFFTFLDDFFAMDADINHSGATDSQDLFDFLSCMLSNPAGCV